MKIFLKAPVLAATLSVATLVTPALADKRVEGKWQLDIPATIDAARTSGVPVDQLGQLQANLTEMAKAFSMTFTGARLEAIAGETTTHCDWAWSKDDYLVPANCLDQKGKPNDLDPEREAIRMVGGNLQLINIPEGLALILRRP